MHDCQRFRENWIAGSRGRTRLRGCRVSLGKPPQFLPPWMRCRPGAPNFPRILGRFRQWPDRDRRGEGLEAVARYSSAWTDAFAAAACTVVAVTWGTFRLPDPTVQQADATQAYRIEYVDDHIKELDTHVVDYLGRSELFLRTFTKIEPSRTEDIEDARVRASRNLAGIAMQKTAAGDFAPVRIVLDEYESVLREIKNMDSSEDIADIKTRIQRNGLIANLKAYQPRVVLVSQP
jgi:hypothetical protein